MNREYELTAEESGQRLDKYLAEKMTDLSRSRIKELVQAGKSWLMAKRAKFHIKCRKVT